MPTANEPPRQLRREQWAQLEPILNDFEAAWQRGDRPSLDQYLRRTPTARSLALIELAHIDLEYRLRAGDPAPLVEGYFERYPTQLAEPEAALGLIVAEFNHRRGREAAVTRAEYLRRFPRFADQLPGLLKVSLRCPHCATIVELLDEPPRVVTCPSCARTFPATPASRAATVTASAAKDLTGQPAARRACPFPPAGGLPALFGRYRVLKLLGQGAMGSVYLAHDTQLDRQVALKIPLFAAEDRPQQVERFYREARAAAGLRHPNLCPVHDVGEVEGVPYLTMAYIEGKPLACFLRGPKPLPQRQAGLLVRKLALGLAEAHQRGVIHRDLKPGNVMIDKRGEPIVMDFGLARRSRSGDALLTQKGQVLGTPAYMAPEQVSGDTVAMSPACDIYSLGIILYELLAGRLPFEGDVMAVLAQVLTEEPPPPSHFRPEVAPDLEAICRKAIAKKATERYASMADFAAALLEHLRPKAAALKTAPTLAPAAKTAGTKSADIGLGAFASIARRFGLSRAATTATPAPTPPRWFPSKLGIRGIALAASVLVIAGCLAAFLYVSRPANAPGDDPEKVMAQRHIDFTGHMKRGAEAMVTKNYAEASDAYGAALKLFPDDPDALNRRVEAITLAQIEKEKDKRKGDYEQWMVQGDKAVADREWEAAVRAFENAIRVMPGDERANQRLAEARASLAAFKGAAAQKADYLARMDAGRKALDGRRYADAYREFLAAWRLVPGDADATQALAEAEKKLRAISEGQERQAECDRLVDRARAALKEKRFDDAINLTQAALRLNPGDKDATAFLDKARQALSEARSEFPRLINQGTAALNGKHWDEAVARFTDASALSPDDPVAKDGLRLAQFGKAMAQAADALITQNYLKAQDNYAEAVRLVPDNLQAVNQLAMVRSLIEFDRLMKDLVSYSRCTAGNASHSARGQT
jgi:tetratricopeptide (TPR) repeat protein